MNFFLTLILLNPVPWKTAITTYLLRNRTQVAFNPIHLDFNLKIENLINILSNPLTRFNKFMAMAWKDVFTNFYTFTVGRSEHVMQNWGFIVKQEIKYTLEEPQITGFEFFSVLKKISGVNLLLFFLPNSI